mmetsp:Transcript_27536/g.41636  ORF Transcript_27536/g.41636 Transcript_27536/m.41636 type:complete len:112 (-) Transcript_27536:24-359(-)
MHSSFAIDGGAATPRALGCFGSPKRLTMNQLSHEGKEGTTTATTTTTTTVSGGHCLDPAVPPAGLQDRKGQAGGSMRYAPTLLASDRYSPKRVTTTDDRGKCRQYKTSEAT